VEWLAVAFALLIVHAALFRKLIYPSIGDSIGYRTLARRLVESGLFSAVAYDPIRTYGYPLFLSPLVLIERFTSIPLELLAAELQCAVYLSAAWLLRSEIRRISRRLSEWVFIAFCLNVFVLGYVAETLTESLTLSLITLVGWCWLWSVRSFRSRSWMLAATTGSLLAGFAVMVRPANLFLVAAWIVGQAMLALRRRIGPRIGEASRRAAVFVLALAAVAAPCIPQFYNNIIFGRVATPLLASDLPTLQLFVGIRNLKIVYGLNPLPAVAVQYVNPFAIATSSSIDRNQPLRWYRENPGAGLATIILHEFALLDQDFLFIYIVDISPPYRIPLTMINHAGIGLAVYALWLSIRARTSGGRRMPILRISWPVISLFIVGVCAIYGGSQVEARYGLPLILIAAPLAVGAIFQLRYASGRRRALVAGMIAFYTISAVLASQWMRSQSPVIVKLENAHLFR